MCRGAPLSALLGRVLTIESFATSAPIYAKTTFGWPPVLESFSSFLWKSDFLRTLASRLDGPGARVVLAREVVWRRCPWTAARSLAISSGLQRAPAPFRTLHAIMRAEGGITQSCKWLYGADTRNSHRTARKARRCGCHCVLVFCCTRAAPARIFAYYCMCKCYCAP